MPSIVILLREWMKVSRPPSTPTQDIFPETNLDKNLLVEKKIVPGIAILWTYKPLLCNICNTSLITANLLPKWDQITQELDLKYPPAPLACCWCPAWIKWWKNLNTFWFYRTNETWQTYQRFYPNAWLVEEFVWKCCRRRLICKKHLILTMFLW